MLVRKDEEGRRVMERKQMEQLFFIQRDATVGVTDGAISFANPAALARYPDLAIGTPATVLLPTEILTQTEDNFSASATVRDEICTVLGSRVEETRIYTLIPQTKPDMEAGRLLENVCNSMRRTLTVLNMATELLTPAIDQLEEPRQQSNIKAINKSYYKLQRLCDNLDHLARLPQGKERPRLEHVDLVDFCRDLVQSADHFVRKQGHKLYFQSELAQLVTAVDSPKLSKLLLNLISNSLKRLPQGGSLHLNLSSSGEDVTLAFRDSGEGIPPTELAHVFTQYQREPSGTDTKAGVGLGLAVAQEIASLHGGTLLLSSNEGKGTTVLLRLPIQRLEADGVLQETALPYGEGDDGGMHRILMELADVLDDEAFGRKYRD